MWREEPSSKLGKGGMSQARHLNEMQHIAEDGALLAPVGLGSVLVAVCGQGFQFCAEQVSVFIKEILLWQKKEMNSVRQKLQLAGSERCRRIERPQLFP